MIRIAIVLGAWLVLAQSARADEPPTDPSAIDILTMNGTGCSPGSVAIRMSPDNTSFDVGHSGNFTAVVGVGAGATDFLKICRLSLLVHAPEGYAYAIASVDHRAFTSLVAGATGRHRAFSFFHGRSPTPVADHAFAGPLQGAWRATETFDDAQLVFSACSPVALNLNTEIRVSAGTSDPRTTTSHLSMVGSDVASGSTTYHLVWRRCG